VILCDSAESCSAPRWRTTSSTAWRAPAADSTPPASTALRENVRLPSKRCASLAPTSAFPRWSHQSSMSPRPGTSRVPQPPCPLPVEAPQPGRASSRVLGDPAVLLLSHRCRSPVFLGKTTPSPTLSCIHAISMPVFILKQN